MSSPITAKCSKCRDDLLVEQQIHHLSSERIRLTQFLKDLRDSLGDYTNEEMAKLINLTLNDVSAPLENDSMYPNSLTWIFNGEERLYPDGNGGYTRRRGRRQEDIDRLATLKVKVTCPECNGLCYFGPNYTKPCKTCKGQAVVEE
jgi:hypothetical protein